MIEYIIIAQNTIFAPLWHKADSEMHAGSILENFSPDVGHWWDAFSSS